MNYEDCRYPFGSPLTKVEQSNRSPKQAFVLGVYASAVHARWSGPAGELLVAALAVASEPEIFWRGDPVQSTKIISQILIPPELGYLKPAPNANNGPSGRALDELILTPLHLNRDNTWLCDLIPYSLANDNQLRVITEKYLPLVDQYDLPIPSIPPVPVQLTDSDRRSAILTELEASQAETLILLGDKPIQWFLDYYLDTKINRLADFTDNYGSSRILQINGRHYSVYAFAHPRQIAGLGFHNGKWFDLHQQWLASQS